jgi:hypothetical protein
LQAAVLADIAMHFDQHPIILILSPENRESMLKCIAEQKYRCAEGAAFQVLAEVR